MTLPASRVAISFRSLVSSEVTKYESYLGFFFSRLINTPPGAKQTVKGDCPVYTTRRIVSLFGHYHAHTTRFSVWNERGSSRELVYESYNWEEPGTLQYDSLTPNVKPDPKAGTVGGHNGILTIKPHDNIHFECEIDNTTNATLKNGNEVFTAEMCNLFGTFESPNPSGWGCAPPRPATPAP